MTYGFAPCLICCGYGVVLSDEEYNKGLNDMLQGEPLDQLSDSATERMRCHKCKGTGWLLLPNQAVFILPNNTKKRW